MIYLILGFEGTMRKLTALTILFLLVLPLSGCLDEQNRDDDAGSDGQLQKTISMYQQTLMPYEFVN